MHIKCSCMDKDPHIIEKYVEQVSALIELNAVVNGMCGKTLFHATAHYLGLAAVRHPTLTAEQVREDIITQIDCGIAAGKIEKEAAGDRS